MIGSRKTKKRFQYVILFALLGVVHLSMARSTADETEALRAQAESLIFTAPDSAIHLFLNCLDYYEAVSDTNRIVEIKMFLVGSYSGMGKYHLAYDYAWSLIPMLGVKGFEKEKVEIFRSIAILYTMFEQYDKAFQYLDVAIENAENLDLNSSQMGALLSKLHSSKAWLVTESKQDYKWAEKERLKSIEYALQSDDKVNLRFQKMHLGQLYVETNRLDEASKILKEIEKQVIKTPNPIHSLLFNYLGHLYLKLNNVDTAIFYFEKSVDAINTYKNHLDIEVEILETLAYCYEQKNMDAKALMYLKEAKSLTDSLFGGRSSQNKVLFEIKDRYSQELEQKEQELKNHKLMILERDNELWLFRSILLVIIFCVVMILLITRYRRMLNKQKTAQDLLRKKKELEAQKQREVIEIKNKELMTSALKLIERDTLLDDIKKFLLNLDVKPENKKIVRQYTQSITIDKSKKWEEFELYFNTVNNSFYSAIKEQFPQLSSTDLKMCALIKLGFSSKDMAQIMMIGVRGINTSRSRIRKKMGLARDVNLVDFLQNYIVSEDKV